MGIGTIPHDFYETLVNICEWYLLQKRTTCKSARLENLDPHRKKLRPKKDCRSFKTKRTLETIGLNSGRKRKERCKSSCKIRKTNSLIIWICARADWISVATRCFYRRESIFSSFAGERRTGGEKPPLDQERNFRYLWLDFSPKSWQLSWPHLFSGTKRDYTEVIKKQQKRETFLAFWLL